MSRNLLKSFGLQSISMRFNLLSVHLSCRLQAIFRKFVLMGKSLYSESGQCSINGLFGLVVFLHTLVAGLDLECGDPYDVVCWKGI